MKLDYTAQYYDHLSTGSSNSAAAIVPVVVEFIQPRSVVDLGCGTGTWLAEFKRHGVGDILGIDGTHITADQLAIDSQYFFAADLTQPLRISGQFDLAISLEVAEHLGAAEADQFVESLSRLAPVVLFSAAIPHQGGKHHVNEQWPMYWSERFKSRGFVALDPFRRFLWERADVDWWYAQNLMLFIRQDEMSRFPNLTAWIEFGFPTYVHPRNYLKQAWQNRVLHVAVDLATATQSGDTIILADEDQFGSLYLPGRETRPFVERNGLYFGPPASDKQALTELKRMQSEGAHYFAVGWPAFWWLKYYVKLAAYLDEQSSAVVRNEHVILYRLTP